MPPNSFVEWMVGSNFPTKKKKKVSSRRVKVALFTDDDEERDYVQLSYPRHGSAHREVEEPEDDEPKKVKFDATSSRASNKSTHSAPQIAGGIVTPVSQPEAPKGNGIAELGLSLMTHPTCTCPTCVMGQAILRECAKEPTGKIRHDNVDPKAKSGNGAKKKNNKDAGGYDSEATLTNISGASETEPETEPESEPEPQPSKSKKKRGQANQASQKTERSNKSPTSSKAPSQSKASSSKASPSKSSEKSKFPQKGSSEPTAQPSPVHTAAKNPSSKSSCGHSCKETSSGSRSEAHRTSTRSKTASIEPVVVTPSHNPPMNAYINQDLSHGQVYIPRPSGPNGPSVSNGQGGYFQAPFQAVGPYPGQPFYHQTIPMPQPNGHFNGQQFAPSSPGRFFDPYHPMNPRNMQQQAYIPGRGGITGYPPPNGQYPPGMPPQQQVSFKQHQLGSQPPVVIPQMIPQVIVYQSGTDQHHSTHHKSGPSPAPSARHSSTASSASHAGSSRQKVVETLRVPSVASPGNKSSSHGSAKSGSSKPATTKTSSPSGDSQKKSSPKNSPPKSESSKKGSPSNKKSPKDGSHKSNSPSGSGGGWNQNNTQNDTWGNPNNSQDNAQNDTWGSNTGNAQDNTQSANWGSSEDQAADSANSGDNVEPAPGWGASDDAVPVPSPPKDKLPGTWNDSPNEGESDPPIQASYVRSSSDRKINTIGAKSANSFLAVIIGSQEDQPSSFPSKRDKKSKGKEVDKKKGNGKEREVVADKKKEGKGKEKKTWTNPNPQTLSTDTSKDVEPSPNFVPSMPGAWERASPRHKPPRIWPDTSAAPKPSTDHDNVSFIPTTIKSASSLVSGGAKKDGTSAGKPSSPSSSKKKNSPPAPGAASNSKSSLSVMTPNSAQRLDSWGNK
ncbi:hypothetical protein OQA88_463 [Cercophora sp. LCS_1]